MKARILIVDDSRFARRTLRQLLEEGGHGVEEAADGSEALEKYFLHKPDLVLLDLVMEGIDGLEVLKKLREMDPNAEVVIATADIQSATRADAEAAGAAGYVTKPFNREELLAAVSDVLSRRVS